MVVPLLLLKKRIHIHTLQYLYSHFKRVINPSRANDYGQAEVRVSIAGDDMSVGGTWTAYAFVIGKRNHFLLSDKEKKEYFEKDPDRRGSGTLGHFSVCNGCGKEKSIRNEDGRVVLQAWLAHKLRCKPLQYVFLQDLSILSFLKLILNINLQEPA